MIAAERLALGAALVTGALCARKLGPRRWVWQDAWEINLPWYDGATWYAPGLVARLVARGLLEATESHKGKPTRLVLTESGYATIRSNVNAESHRTDPQH